jgi:hypothetical protein
MIKTIPQLFIFKLSEASDREKIFKTFRVCFKGTKSGSRLFLRTMQGRSQWSARHDGAHF